MGQFLIILLSTPPATTNPRLGFLHGNPSLVLCQVFLRQRFEETKTSPGVILLSEPLVIILVSFHKQVIETSAIHSLVGHVVVVVVVAKVLFALPLAVCGPCTCFIHGT